MKRFLYLIFFFPVILFWSCNPFRYIDIQALKPAKTSLSNQIDTLFLINSLRFKTQKNDSVETVMHKEFLKYFNATLIYKLKESPLFQNTSVKMVSIPYIYKHYQNSDYESRKRIFIFRTDSINIKDTINKIKVYYDDDYVGTVLEYKAIYKVYLHLSNYIHSTQQFTVVDTFFWESPTLYSFNSFVLHKEVFYKEIGRLTAEKFSRDIAPFWYTDERMIYYSSNKLMRQGYKKFVDNDMFSSIAYWKKLFDAGTRNLAHKAAYNIALSYETMDSLYLSQEWLEKSMQVKKTTYASDYLTRIKKRIQEKEELDKQFQLLYKQIN